MSAFSIQGRREGVCTTLVRNHASCDFEIGWERWGSREASEGGRCRSGPSQSRHLQYVEGLRLRLSLVLLLLLLLLLFLLPNLPVELSPGVCASVCPCVSARLCVCVSVCVYMRVSM